MTIIGRFAKTEAGFNGTISTLAIKAQVTLQKNTAKQQHNHPDFELVHQGDRIGAAWSRDGKRGRYISLSLDDPSFAPGFYSLTKAGAGHGYTLSFERPRASK